MRLFKILKKPVATEKAANLEFAQNTYVFEVSADATKIDVKKAATVLYGVDVESVNILNTIEKTKMGKNKSLVKKRKTSKKAYVKLKDTSAKIDFSVIK